MSKIDPDILNAFPRFTLPQVLWRQAEHLGPHQVAIREKRLGIWQTHRWGDYLRYVRLTALGLLALGARRGETVALLLGNQSEWLFSTLGAQALGCVTFSLPSGTLSAETRQYLIETQPAILITAGRTEIFDLLPFRKDLSFLRRLVYVDPASTRTLWDDPWMISFAEVLELGEELDAEQPDLFIKELWEGGPDDPSRLIVSHCDSEAQVVRSAHRNQTSLAASWLSSISFPPKPDWASFEPTTSSVEQMWCLEVAICAGMAVNFPESPLTAASDLHEIQPDFVAAGTVYWERLAARIWLGGQCQSSILRRLYALTLKSGAGDSGLQDSHKSSAAPSPFRWFLRQVIAHPLKARLGFSRCRAAFCIGSAVGDRTLNFLRAYGIPLQQVPLDSLIKRMSAAAWTGALGSEQRGGTASFDLAGASLPTARRPQPSIGEVRAGRARLAAQEKEEPPPDDAPKGETSATDAANRDSRSVVESAIRSIALVRQALVIEREGRRIGAIATLDIPGTVRWARLRGIGAEPWEKLLRSAPVHNLLREELREVNRSLPHALRIQKLIVCGIPAHNGENSDHLGESLEPEELDRWACFLRLREDEAPADETHSRERPNALSAIFIEGGTVRILSVGCG